MIKLINLLELNVNNSRITPELVCDYFEHNIYNNFLHHNFDKWQLYKNFCKPYCKKYDIDGWVGGKYDFEKLSYPDLIQLYKGMQELVKSYQINELEIGNNNTKQKFIKYVKSYFHILNKLNPLICQRYQTKNFNGLSDIIIQAFEPIKHLINIFSDFNIFSEWIKGIDTEYLGIKSSGSFHTALYDTDFIYEGEEHGLTEDECEDLALNCENY